MNDQENVTNDTFYAHVFWLDEWFTPAKHDILHITDQAHHMIFNELTTLHWKEPDIIAQLNVLQERFGAKVIEVIAMVVAENSRRDWAEIARHEKSHTIDDLIRLLWGPGREKGCEFTMYPHENGVQMRCTRCPYVELGKKINGTKWLYYLVCMADP